MEGSRVSKLEERQQWGKNTSSQDKVQWRRRPPFIGGKKSNRYAHSPHRAVVPLDITVLPQGVAVLLLREAVLLLRRFFWLFCLLVVVFQRATTALTVVPLLGAVVPLCAGCEHNGWIFPTYKRGSSSPMNLIL